MLAIADALAHSSSLTLPSALGARDGSMICPYFSCLHKQHQTTLESLHHVQAVIGIYLAKAVQASYSFACDLAILPVGW